MPRTVTIAQRVEVIRGPGSSLYGNNALFAVAQTAAQLGVEEIFLGVSQRYPADYLIEQFAIYWGMVQADGDQHVVLRTVDARREVRQEL